MLLSIKCESWDKPTEPVPYLGSKEPHSEHVQLLPLHVLRRAHSCLLTEHASSSRLQS